MYQTRVAKCIKHLWRNISNACGEVYQTRVAHLEVVDAAEDEIGVGNLLDEVLEVIDGRNVVVEGLELHVRVNAFQRRRGRCDLKRIYRVSQNY